MPYYIAHLLHAGLAPVKGHAGFHRVILHSNPATGTEHTVELAGYFHYLHHRFVSVNFGNITVPLDFWLNTAYDGTDASRAAMQARRRRKHATRRNDPAA